MLSKSYTMENMTRGGWEPVNHSIQDFWPESSLRSQNRITTYFYLRNQTAAFSDVSSNASLAPHLGVYSTHTLGFHTSHSQLQAENEYLKPVYGFNVSSTFFPKKLFITSTSIWISRKNPAMKAKVNHLSKFQWTENSQCALWKPTHNNLSSSCTEGKNVPHRSH